MIIIIIIIIIITRAWRMENYVKNVYLMKFKECIFNLMKHALCNQKVNK